MIVGKNRVKRVAAIFATSVLMVVVMAFVSRILYAGL